MISDIAPPAAGTGSAGQPMRFSVDGWDPSYGASLELEEQLRESTASVAVDVELPATRWQAIDPTTDRALPAAILFVDGVRRIEARVWIDDETISDGARSSDATAALCASYAAGVVCCSGDQAHLVMAEMRRGLFSVARHASDIVTRAGRYQAHYIGSGSAAVPLMARLSQGLQRRLAEIEMVTAVAARSSVHGHGLPPDDDLLIIDGPLRGRQHLPRALGYIKSHHSTYLPPELNALVGRLSPGQRTPVFLMGTSWDRHSWYLRLPGAPGAPWAGIVRVECAADLSRSEVIRLADLSQACLGRFASAPYKDSRAPQNLYPIGGLEHELRHRLGDQRLLFRALSQAAHELARLHRRIVQAAIAERGPRARGRPPPGQISEGLSPRGGETRQRLLVPRNQRVVQRVRQQPPGQRLLARLGLQLTQLTLETPERRHQTFAVRRELMTVQPPNPSLAHGLLDQAGPDPDQRRLEGAGKVG
jgi:hypothetical protein